MNTDPKKLRIYVDTIKYGFEQTMIKHPRFSSKLVSLLSSIIKFCWALFWIIRFINVTFEFGGKVFDATNSTKPIGWVQTDLQVHEHIIVLDLDPNMDSLDQFVEDYTSHISKTPMDVSKPLWEFHVLNAKTLNSISIGA